MRATRPDRPYRAFYNAKGGSNLALDYMAENRLFALTHAFHVLNGDEGRNGLVGLLKVQALKLGEARNLGAFIPHNS